MPLPIVHFAVGIIGGVILLMNFPQFFGDIIKNDLFIILGSGLWAMIPDAPALWKNLKFDDKPIMNIFWFHYSLDKKFKDDFDMKISFVIIGISVFALLIYYGGI